MRAFDNFVAPLIVAGFTLSAHAQTVFRFHGDIIDVKFVPAFHEYCHIVRFPGGWQYQRATASGQPLSFAEHANYEFRAEGLLSTWFLVGGFEDLIGRYDAANHYRVKLSDGAAPVRPASREDWDSAAVVSLARKSVLRLSPEPLPTDPATFRGLRLTKTGAQWASPSEYGSRLSPDSAWLVLMSYTHRRKFSDEHHESSVYWDVFNAETGGKLLTIEGTYSGWGNDPSYTIGRAAWLTERYFIIPLGEHIEKCLVCEFGKVN